MNTCAVEECQRPSHAYGWCGMHYARRKRTGDVGSVGPMRERQVGFCDVDGCDIAADSRGFCKLHYMRWLRTGDATKVKSLRARVVGVDRVALAYERFVSSLVLGDIDEDGSPHILCETPTVRGRGYAVFSAAIFPNGYRLAHRYAFELWVGPIPPGHDLDHRPSCPKNCVNPLHLTPLTPSEHARLSIERGEIVIVPGLRGFQFAGCGLTRQDPSPKLGDECKAGAMELGDET